MTENGRDVSDEPVEDCEVETPDWNRFKPEAAMACVTPNQCYTTKQVARKLGINAQAVHNLCYRNPKMAEALGRQQFQAGPKCYFLKLAVNAFCDSRKKIGLARKR